jgi:hypothetical protein
MTRRRVALACGGGLLTALLAVAVLHASTGEGDPPVQDRWLHAIYDGRYEDMCALSDPSSLDQAGGCDRVKALLEEALEHADAEGAAFDAAPHRPAHGMLSIGRLELRFRVPAVEENEEERVVFDVAGSPGARA